MSFDRFAGAMRSQAVRAMSGVRSARTGIVSSFDATAYSVRVRLQPDDVETGWLPIWSPWVGNNWGLICPPSIDDQVLVLFEEGDPDTGKVLGGFYSQADKPPLNPSTEEDVKQGEFYLVHNSGSALSFNNDGTVHLIANDVLTVDAPEGMVINADKGVSITAVTGGVEINGDIFHDGQLETTKDIFDQTGSGNTVSVKALRDKYNAHKHAGVQPGGGQTATTTAPAV